MSIFGKKCFWQKPKFRRMTSFYLHFGTILGHFWEKWRHKSNLGVVVNKFFFNWRFCKEKCQKWLSKCLPQYNCIQKLLNCFPVKSIIKINWVSHSLFIYFKIVSNTPIFSLYKKLNNADRISLAKRTFVKLYKWEILTCFYVGGRFYYLLFIHWN